MKAGPTRAVLDALQPADTHREVTIRLRSAGWTPCGSGDWAWALLAPEGEVVARISPFDPVGPYTAQLYRDAAHTSRVPQLHAHRHLAGGGDLLLMERLHAVPEPEASAFHDRLAVPEPELRELAGIVTQVHRRAIRELPWCGPLDHNPANVMRTGEGTLVLTDPYYADGPNLYATALSEPDVVVARIPEPERRFMADIPMACSGPWKPGEQDDLREKLRRADERLTDR